VEPTLPSLAKRVLRTPTALLLRPVFGTGKLESARSAVKQVGAHGGRLRDRSHRGAKTNTGTGNYTVVARWYSAREQTIATGRTRARSTSSRHIWKPPDQRARSRVRAKALAPSTNYSVVRILTGNLRGSSGKKRSGTAKRRLPVLARGSSLRPSSRTGGGPPLLIQRACIGKPRSVTTRLHRLVSRQHLLRLLANSTDGAQGKVYTRELGRGNHRWQNGLVGIDAGVSSTACRSRKAR